MKARIVIGCNYGDEGKGTIVARYAKQSGNALNVLTNGGAQRSHSIVTENGNATFRHFGSGTLHGADSYYSRFFILNPMQFAEEHKVLLKKPQHVYRDALCRWSTPYDMMFNAMTEHVIGRKASCGMGIWNTVKRYRETPVWGFDMFMRNGMKMRLLYLKNIKSYYERRMRPEGEWSVLWNSDDMVAHFIEDCEYMYNNTTVCGLDELVYDDVIFENGQGLLLSDTGEDVPDRTPSDTGISYGLRLATGMGISRSDITAHYVTRPYLTRHGDGHVEGGEVSRRTLSSHMGDERTNVWNEFQGCFRYGMLDIRSLAERVSSDSNGIGYEVEVTHCDEMDRSDEFKSAFGKVNFYGTAVV